MTPYISFEWLKLTKRWMPRILIILMLALTVLIFWGQATHGSDQGNLSLPRGWLTALILASFFAPFFWPVLGGSWAGNEYGWGTIRMVLTRRPNRILYVLGSLIVLLITVALGLIAIMLVGTVAGYIAGASSSWGGYSSGVLGGSFIGTLLKTFFSAWYVGAFYLVLAFTAATMFRSAAVGIGVGIGSTLAQFILTGILSSLGGTWKEIAQHFPVVYTNDFVRAVAYSGLIRNSDIARGDPSAPNAGQSLIALTIFMAVLLVATFIVVRQRDVTA